MHHYFYFDQSLFSNFSHKYLYFYSSTECACTFATSDKLGFSERRVAGHKGPRTHLPWACWGRVCWRKPRLRSPAAVFLGRPLNLRRGEKKQKSHTAGVSATDGRWLQRQGEQKRILQIVAPREKEPPQTSKTPQTPKICSTLRTYSDSPSANGTN